MTMTVGELIAALSQHAPDTPVFFCDSDKQLDRRIDIVELTGPIYEADGEDLVPTVPCYCKSTSRVEEYWHNYGVCPIIYLAEDYYK